MKAPALKIICRINGFCFKLRENHHIVFCLQLNKRINKLKLGHPYLYFCEIYLFISGFISKKCQGSLQRQGLDGKKKFLSDEIVDKGK